MSEYRALEPRSYLVVTSAFYINNIEEALLSVMPEEIIQIDGSS